MQGSYKGKAITGARLFEPTPDDLRFLVLDYLCHTSYRSTVRAFARDSAVNRADPEGDTMMPTSEESFGTLEERLSSGESRKEIRVRILSGRVDEAIELLNKHYPSVLSESTESIPTLTIKDKLEYIPSTSVNPAHLSLNLHILAFVEAARTVPLPYYPPGSSPPRPERVDQDVDMMREDSEEMNVRLLHRAQNLYAEANSLPDANDRTLYLKELNKVGGLLAYPVPERSPLAEYLSQERREAVADQIEKAILYRTGEPVISSLELAARQTTVVWSMLHALKVKPPPPSTWPAGVSLPGAPKPVDLTAVKTSGVDSSVTSKKPPAGGEPPAEVVPEFNLRTFLNAPP